MSTLRRSSEVANRLILLLRSIGPVPGQSAKAHKHARKTVLCMKLGVGVLSPHPHACLRRSLRKFSRGIAGNCNRKIVVKCKNRGQKCTGFLTFAMEI